jgi:hypothetical protein
MRRVVATFAFVVALLMGLVLLTGTRGGLAYFSPHTLEYQTQSEFTVLGGTIPIYRSPRRNVENELATFLHQQGYAAVVQPQDQRWEVIFHWNHAWKDGQGSLYDVFGPNRHEIIKWSQADPERAKIYWSEGLKHLRSNNLKDERTGYSILLHCWRAKSIPELREQIAGMKLFAQE